MDTWQVAAHTAVALKAPVAGFPTKVAITCARNVLEAPPVERTRRKDPPWARDSAGSARPPPHTLTLAASTCPVITASFSTALHASNSRANDITRSPRETAVTRAARLHLIAHTVEEARGCEAWAAPFAVHATVSSPTDASTKANPALDAVASEAANSGREARAGEVA